MVAVVRYAGFAEESSFAVSPAPDAVYHVDIASATLDAPTDPQIVFPGGLGRGAVTHRPGAYAPGGNIVQGTDIRTIGYLLKWALGGYDFTAGVAGTNAAQTITITGTPTGGSFTVTYAGQTTAAIAYNAAASAVEDALELLSNIGVGNISCSGGALPGTPVVCTFVGALAARPIALMTVGTNSLSGGTDPAAGITTSTPGVLPGWGTHELFASDDNRLPSFTARIGKDLFEHVFSGCGINSLQIESENEFVMATADVIASKDAKATIEEIDDLLLPDAYPLAFHELTVTRALGNISCAVRSMQLTINNGLSSSFGQGSRHPCHQIAGEREVTLSMTLIYESLDHLTAFWGDANGPAEAGSSEFALSLKLDAGTAGELDIALPRCIYTAVPTQPSGRTEITQNVAIKAFVTEHTLADATTVVRSEMLATLQNRNGEMVAVTP